MHVLIASRILKLCLLWTGGSFPFQLAINNLVRTILGWIQMITIPVGCAWLGNVIIVSNNRPEPMYATIVIAVMALVIAKAFSVVFSCVLDSLFVCCCRDKNDYSGAYMPDGLRKTFGFDKRKKTEASYEDEGDAQADDGGYIVSK